MSGIEVIFGKATTSHFFYLDEIKILHRENKFHKRLFAEMVFIIEKGKK